MPRPARLTDDERTAALASLPGWVLVDGREAIARTFRFKDFSQAWGFMSRAALAAEQLDHHPEWFNVWNRVEVVLATHDAGGLTELDVRLAQAMDRIAGG
jgi:4a-hydroxytetrahydrobiopterin dehydratase